jgi:hypothetical protein
MGRAEQAAERAGQVRDRIGGFGNPGGELAGPAEPLDAGLLHRGVRGEQPAHRVGRRQFLRVGRVRAGQADRGGDQLGTLQLHAAQDPVPAERGGQPHGGDGIAGCDRTAHRRVQVVLVIGQPAEPVQLLRAAQVVLAGLGQPGEVLRVRPAQRVPLPRLGQPLQAVGTDDLQHQVPGSLGTMPHGQQRLVRERGQQVEDLARGDPRARADLLGGFQGGAACEDREPAPEHLLGLVEQVPAPVDHRAQCPVPGQRDPAAAGQQPEPVVQAGRDLVRGQGAQPGRGQLDGQRHAVKRPADPGHRGRVGRGDLEARQHGTGPLGQQPDRGGRADGRGG